MTILTREVLPNDASITVQSSPPFATSGTATRNFIVESDTPIDVATVLNQVPAKGSAHPYLAGLYALSAKAQPVRKDRRAWHVQVDYSTLQGTDQQWQEDPLLRPPKLSWSTVSFSEDFVKTVDGKAVVNSAGDHYDPPIQVQRSRWQVTYTKNVAAVPATLTQYIDAINSDTFTIGGLTVLPRCAKLDAISISGPNVENGVTYWELAYTFSFCRSGDTWQPKILDAGMYERIEVEQGKYIKRRIRLNGEPVTSPVLLDGNGRVLQNPSPDTAVWREFKAYQELPFAPLL